MCKGQEGQRPSPGKVWGEETAKRKIRPEDPGRTRDTGQHPRDAVIG